MGLSKVRGFNLLMFLLIVIEVAMLLYIATTFVFNLVNDSLNIGSVFSGVLLFVITLPMSAYLYWTSKDQIQRLLFLGMMLNFAILSLSGFIWEILSKSFDFPWLMPAAQLLALICYIPLTYAILSILYKMRDRLEKRISIIILMVNAFCACLIILLALANYQTVDNPVLTFVYTGSIIFDIVLLSALSVLVLITLPTQHRYLFSILFIYVFMSLIGDTLRLFDILGMSDSWALSQFVYDIMFTFIAAALLLYSSKTITSMPIEEVHKKLDDTRRFMDDMLMQMPDPVCIIDTSGRTIQVNDAFVDMFHVDRETMIGSDRISKMGSSLGFMDERNKERLRNGETIMVSSVHIKIPGQITVPRYVSIKIFPAYDSDGKIVGYISMFEDVTVRIKLEAELHNAYDELKKEYDRKVEFTRSAAHELRTPLTPILGYAEILKSELTDPTLKHHAEVIERNALRQKHTIDRMLELSMLDAKKVDVINQQVNAAKLVRDVMENYSTCEREVLIDIPESMTIDTDTDKLYIILDNLISNAVQYSPRGGKISVKAEELNNVFLFSIKDNGKGISQDDCDRVFERFFVGSDDKPHEGRMRMGLALVRGYVDTLGGRVWLESKIGEGSTFYFNLPKHMEG